MFTDFFLERRFAIFLAVMWLAFQIFGGAFGSTSVTGLRFQSLRTALERVTVSLFKVFIVRCGNWKI